MRIGSAAHRLEGSAEEQALSQFMRQAQKGDREAYRALLLKLEPIVASYVRNALRRCGISPAGSAEDIVQEVLLAIHSKKHTYDPEHYFLPWMFAISRYKLIDALRSSKVRGKVLPLEKGEAEGFSVDPGVRKDVQDLLALLPEKQRTLLELVKLEGFSIEETSKKTGFSVSDVKVSLHRALKALRKNTSSLNHEDE